MPVHQRPIAERIEWLLELARAHESSFGSPEATLARQRYQAEHPTLVMAMKCMDGRVHLPHATRTPQGIIEPLRNLGGIFDLGWPHLGEVVHQRVSQAVGQGRRVLLLITYHFSRGDRCRGCAGFDLDTDAAIAHARRVRGQVEAIFGSGHQTVYPLLCGFETDEDALVLHGPAPADGCGEARLELASLAPDRGESLDARLAALCPDMPQQVRADLLPLLRGNLAHLHAQRGSDRQLDLVHREWAICVGRGFDFLHVPNVALIVGPFGPELGEPIGTAADILAANMREGRIPRDGFLLLASSPYHEGGADRARAAVKARFLAGFAADTIARRQPELAARMHRLTATVHWPTRALRPLPQPSPALPAA